MKKVTLEVEAALAAHPQAATDIHAPYTAGSHGLTARGGLAALVTFNVAGPHAHAQTTVLTDLAAVHQVQVLHPDLQVREAGDASTDRVASALLGNDFRKSEWSSVPLTLILLIAVFGALIALLHPGGAGGHSRGNGCSCSASPGAGSLSAPALPSWCW